MSEQERRSLLFHRVHTWFSLYMGGNGVRRLLPTDWGKGPSTRGSSKEKAFLTFYLRGSWAIEKDPNCGESHDFTLHGTA